jgi:hypothetical protein
MVRIPRPAAIVAPALLAGVVAFVAAGGCVTPYEGIRLRADAPMIDDAFRKLTIALTVDGYELDTVDPGLRVVDTEWKALGEKDLEPSVLGSGVRHEGKVRIKLEPRGQFYDVLLTPSLRTDASNERTAKPTERLWLKWETALHRLLVLQAKEE